MITATQLQNATMCKPQMVNLFLSSIIEAFNKFQINNPVDQLCFLAQTGHESAGLYYTEELASGEAYEGRKSLGNIQPGDGVRFKGRGLIQITGRSNYQKVSDALNTDFISSPELLGGKSALKSNSQQIKNAVMSAAWFWQSRNLSQLASQMKLEHLDIPNGITHPNLDIYTSITKKINGGTNGLNDRISRFNNGLPSFI